MAGLTQQRRQQILLIVLVIVFATPLFGAWVLIHYTDVGRGSGAASHGQLVQPPRALPDLRLYDPATGASAARLHGKWTMLYLTGAPCGRQCMEALYRMRQLRLAMGKDAERVQRLLAVYGGSLEILSRSQIADYAGQLLVDGERLDPGAAGSPFRLAPGEDPLITARLYLVDPLGNLMLAYAPGTEPAGIIEDLRRLLKYSSIG